MSEQGIKVVYEGGAGEITEKKSRFIANTAPICSEEEAAAFISAKKKEYWDARHNCYAFSIGRNHELTRCSDDGEPSGTAGRPILDILLREDIHNAVVVVTRYFGGVLLGTGGLVRAYQQAAQEGLRQSVVIEKRQGLLMDIHTDYNGLGKIQYILAQHEIAVQDTLYTQKVQIQAVVPTVQKEEIIKAVTEGTNGTARLVMVDNVEFAVIEKKVEIFEKNT